MKKKLIVLSLALMLALPVLGLAGETDAQAPNELPAVGRRWRWNPPTSSTPTETPAPGFVDENNDGICDVCGQQQGTNPNAPGFVDENKDGVCDHLGTDQQGQNNLRNRLHAKRARMQQAQGGRGRQQQPGRNAAGQAPGRNTVQGRNYQDGNKDGVSDNLSTQRQQRQQPNGRGRNRR